MYVANCHRIYQFNSGKVYFKMTSISKILLLCLIATWTWGVGGVASDNKKTISSSSTPEYEQIEKEEIEVALPSSSTNTNNTNLDDNVLNGVPNNDQSSGTVSKIKPRKGVSPDTDGYSTSETYKVKEAQDEVHEPQQANNNNNTNSSASSSVTGELVSVEKSNTNPEVIGKGIVTPLDKPEPSAALPPAPKKPKITYSPEDNPEILKFASNPKKVPGGDDVGSSESSKLPVPNHIQVVEEPSSEFSKEFEAEEVSYGGFLGYIVISALVLTFIAVPVVFGRKLKDMWATRHYRRVDFLVDGMYNE